MRSRVSQDTFSAPTLSLPFRCLSDCLTLTRVPRISEMASLCSSSHQRATLIAFRFKWCCQSSLFATLSFVEAFKPSSQRCVTWTIQSAFCRTSRFSAQVRSGCEMWEPLLVCICCRMQHFCMSLPVSARRHDELSFHSASKFIRIDGERFRKLCTAPNSWVGVSPLQLALASFVGHVPSPALHGTPTLLRNQGSAKKKNLTVLYRTVPYLTSPHFTRLLTCTCVARAAREHNSARWHCTCVYAAVVWFCA